MMEQFNVIDSIDTNKIDWSRINNDAVTVDELTGEVIEIHYDVISGSSN
jgi:hypothetical protein